MNKKILVLNLANDVKKFHTENYKNIAKKVKEDLNKRKGIPGSQITFIINSSCYCCCFLTGSFYIAQGDLQLAM